MNHGFSNLVGQCRENNSLWQTWLVRHSPMTGVIWYKIIHGRVQQGIQPFMAVTASICRSISRGPPPALHSTAALVSAARPLLAVLTDLKPFSHSFTFLLLGVSFLCWSLDRADHFLGVAFSPGTPHGHTNQASACLLAPLCKLEKGTHPFFKILQRTFNC